MKRDLTQFEGKQFDVLIIGGGIYGVCAAWDAALRGLSVALIEKNDFGSATSSNSLKIIHGGLRYLQHADFKRMRESITERTTLMRIAPHLVRPLRCVMPTYGHALQGKEVMAVALWINDLIGFDRNRSLDLERKIPAGHVISKEECLKIMPGIKEENLTGGAVWYDCQVHNSERMLLAILRSAAEAGAVVANYTEMTDFVMHDDRVRGVRAKDTLSGEEFEIRARLVVNNTGPWFNRVLNRLNGKQAATRYELSAAMNLVVRKQLFPDYAVGLWSEQDFKDDDALISKGSRLLFVTPWKDRSLVGTTHVHYDGSPTDFKIREEDIQAFLDELNAAYPPAQLTRDDVTFHYGGLLPMAGLNPKTGDVKLLKSYQIVDHKTEHGLEGLITVVSVKYTTARDVAEKTIDYVLKKLDNAPVRCQTGNTPVFGGDIESYGDFVASATARPAPPLSAAQIERLIENYGSAYAPLVKYAEEHPDWLVPIAAGSDILKAEVVYAVREEMAMKLADVVRRRTELGSAGRPDDSVLEACAAFMGAELGWNKKQQKQEIEETKTIYKPA